jgi:hypothetical protein
MSRDDDLLRRRRRLLAALPPLTESLRGSFLVRRLRCGKADRCRCGRGQLHRAAYVSVTLRRGLTEQSSVPRHLEAQARTWVRNYARWWQAIERLSALNRQLLRRRRQSRR